MSVKITAPKSAIFPILPDGTRNPLYDLITYLPVVGLKFVVQNDVAVAEGITDTGLLTFERVAAVVSFGAEVENLPCFIQLTEQEYAGDVPSYLPHSTDEESNPVAWKDWHSASHSHMKIDDDWFVPGDSWGRDLLGSEIVEALHGGLTLKTLPEMQELVRANQNPN